jgi:hypothetical protein
MRDSSVKGNHRISTRRLRSSAQRLQVDSVSGEAASLAVKLWSQRLHIGMDSAFAATVMMIRQTKPERRKKSFRIMGDSLMSIVLDGQRDLE